MLGGNEDGMKSFGTLDSNEKSINTQRDTDSAQIRRNKKGMRSVQCFCVIDWENVLQ